MVNRNMAKTLSALILTLTIGGCAGVNRTVYTYKSNSENNFTGIRTESEKEKWRYSVGVEAMKSNRYKAGSGNQNIPVIGNVDYEVEKKHREVHLTSELQRNLLPALTPDLELRIGGGAELRISYDDYYYDAHSLGKEYSFKNPIPTIRADVRFFGAATLTFDYGITSQFYQVRIDDKGEKSLMLGAGVKW